MTGAELDSLSGSPGSPTTSETSPGSTGQESSEWTFWPEASLASPSQPPVAKPPKRTRGGSGRSSTEPFALYDPDSSSWRTSQTSLLLETGQPSETFSGTWPRAGMTRNGIAYQRSPLVPHMDEIESSSWPTPTVPNGGRSLPEGTTRTGMTPEGVKRQVDLSQAVKRWPTPTASDAKASGAAGYPTSTTHHAGTTLTDAAVRRMWPTPDAGVFGLTADVDKHMARVKRLKAQKINGNGAGIPLAVEVRRWPTPTARDWKDGSFIPNVAVNGLLGRAVWPTPTASDGMGGPGSSGRDGGENLRTAVDHGEQLANQAGGALNPDWVELLMGFPPGWTIPGQLPPDPSTNGSHPESSPDASPTEPAGSKPSATQSFPKSPSSSDDG